jgi:cytochrome c-type biogenesis protein CcmF
MSGAVVDLWQRTGRSGAARLGRLLRLPRADWGRAMSQAGLGLTIIGVSALYAWVQEDILVAKPGHRFPLGAYEVELKGVTEVPGPNYTALRAEMLVTLNGTPVATLHPEKRTYPVAGMTTTEAAIQQGAFRDIYLVIGDPQDGGGWAVRGYVKPFANWLWAGGILMALGGLVSLTDRRHRLAPAASRKPRAVPAE